jgi:hypothetical protein
VATIVPFLRDGVFDPKDIQAMSMALDGVCKSLNLRDDREREIIAERIVDLARRGVRSPTILRDRVITEISKATQWRPGQSGNPNGRPVGARQTFSAGFHRDLAEVWHAHGCDSMLHTAKTQPSVFFATCARLIGPEVKLTIEQSLPGNLSPSDWADLRELLSAVQ